MNLSLDDLKKQKEELIQLIQSKYPEAYSWLVKNNYDLGDLRTYSLSIAAAFVIATNMSYQHTSALGKESKIMQKDNDEDKYEKLNRLKTNYTSTEDIKAINVIENYGDYINDTSRKYNLDKKVIFATIMVESMGNPKAIRHEPQINDASYGLGQLLYSTARYIGFEGTPDQLFDPKTNIDLIGRYHKRTLEVYGDDLSNDKLATAYNAGNPYGRAIPGHVDKFNKWLMKAQEYNL